MTAIKQITDRWLNDRKQTLLITRGEEARVRISAEIAEAEKHLAAKNEMVAIAQQQDFIRNKFAGRCVKTGEEVKAGAGFAKKSPVGKWETYSFAAVQEIVSYEFNA